METKYVNRRKIRQGVVTSNKMEKTIVVEVTRQYKHPLYGKILKSKKKYHAHDEENRCDMGDTVRIIETRPLSKNKRWRLLDIIEKRK